MFMYVMFQSVFAIQYKFSPVRLEHKTFETIGDLKLKSLYLKIYFRYQLDIENDIFQHILFASAHDFKLRFITSPTIS